MTIDEFISNHIDLITVDNRGLAQATERAAKFLVAQAVISSEIKNLEEQKAKIQTLNSTNYSLAIQGCDAKNITEKKMLADTDANYTEVRELLETIEANIGYLKTHIRIFENAHVLFRQQSKE